MIAPLATALIVSALVLAAVCVLLVAINRRVSGPVLVVVAALEMALAVQSVIGFVLLARTDRPVEALTFIGYLAVILLALPIAAAWSVTERSRWSAGVLAAGCLVVPSSSCGSSRSGPSPVPDRPGAQPPATRSGPGRILIAGYAIFAVAATGRAVLQLATRFDLAPLAYSLSAVADVVYLLATVALVRGNQLWPGSPWRPALSSSSGC